MTRHRHQNRQKEWVKVERFYLTQDLEQTWQISYELAKLALNQMNTFITDKQMKENILEQYPIPSNIIIKKDVDMYMKSILTDKGQKQCFWKKNRKSGNWFVCSTYKNNSAVTGVLNSNFWNYIRPVKRSWSVAEQNTQKTYKMNV